MKIKNEKEVLQAFCENESELRPVLNKPFLNEARNEVWASDGHMCIMVAKSLLRCKYKPNTMGHSLQIPENNSDTVVKVSDIEKTFKKFELKEEMKIEEGEEIDCPVCNGYRWVQWEFTDDDGNTYYKEDDCPFCDGTGYAPEQKKVPTGRMLPPDDAMFVIDDVKFKVDVVMKIAEGLRLLGCKEILHTVTSANSANMFDIQDGIRLMIMPCLGDGICKKVKTKVV
jgi:hypothetical protein